jgi:hypothetical protein
MLYRIRFEYGRNIEATSKSDAVKKMCTLMKEHPESFIRDVHDFTVASNPTPLWKRLITGR